MRFPVLLLATAALAACATPAARRDTVIVGESACAPARFDVYFRENQADLTSAAAQAIALQAGRLAGCEVRRVRVLGLADATGTPEANLTLSQRRARETAEALAAAGLPAPVFDVAAAGDAGAVTADGADQPLRRRAEVVIDARPR